MLKTINGSAFAELIEYGIRNIELHRNELNDLNVFPVPDGDTGTNMLMTLRYGFEAAREYDSSLSEISARLAASASFGARGNSGVILSQFLGGLADGLHSRAEADAAVLSRALSCGYKRAYSAVAKPVEGTMLTVLREAAVALEDALPLDSVDAAIGVYLTSARRSLAGTPDLLPILKKAGVVDSGGSGIVVFFEGMEKCLRGEDIAVKESGEECEVFDFSLVNKDTRFDYGYCVEGLIQLKRDPRDFDHDDFKRSLERCGSSIVTTVIGDKVKLHVHTKNLARVMGYCQDIGELLTVKIENMTLQNLKKKKKEAPERKLLIREDAGAGEFAIVAVAPSSVTQQLFSDMGADVVMLSAIAPSSQEFVDAFTHVSNKNILVFPNSANSILSSMQAGTMYRDAVVTVINCRSVAECYSALAIMDFDGDVASAVASSKETINNGLEFSVYLATKDVKFGSRKISKNEFFSLSNDKILDTGSTVESVTVGTLKKTLAEGEYSVVTLFYSSDLAEEFALHLVDRIGELCPDVEVSAVLIGDSNCSLTVLCE